MSAWSEFSSSGKSTEIISKPDLSFAKIRGKRQSQFKVLFESLPITFAYLVDSFAGEKTVRSGILVSIW